MTADYYTKELEKVIANWHDCGENENPTPIFNIIKLGIGTRYAGSCTNRNSKYISKIHGKY